MLTALLEVLEAKEAIIAFLQNNVASRVQAGDGVSVSMLYKQAKKKTFILLSHFPLSYRPFFFHQLIVVIAAT